MKINKKLAKLMTEKPIKALVSTEDNKLYLYGTIGDDWDGVTLSDIKYKVKDMDKNKLTVFVNSYGGDATEGVAIRNFLKNTFDHIDVFIDGIAASAASVIATCGDTLTMPIGTTFMIHNPWTFVVGGKTDLLKEVGALESLEKSYRNVYMEKFKGTEEELIELMDNESWLTAEEAEQLGFATKVEEDVSPEEPVHESTLVATLISRYAAKATTENTNIQDNVDTNSLDQQEKTKQNNFLKNFAKVFSDI